MSLRSSVATRRAGMEEPARSGVRLRAAAVALALPLLLAVPGASAQDADVGSLANQVQRLQRDIADLQSTVYNGAAPPAGAPSGANLDASQEVRLQELQGQMSALTGRIEELGYQMQRLQERVDVLADAVGGIMRGDQGPAGTPLAEADPMGTGVAPAADPATATSPGTTAATAAPTAPGTTTAPGTLGTLTQQQLETAQSGAPAQGGAVAGGSDAAAVPQSAQTQTQTAASMPNTPYDLPGNTPDEQYQHAFGLLRQADYPQAERALSAFIERNPTSPLAGNAQYWLGETYYVRGDYQKAAVAFAEGYQSYPDSGKAPDNLLKLGMSLGEIGAKEDACTALGQLNRQFPGAPGNIKERAAHERQRLGC